MRYAKYNDNQEERDYIIFGPNHPELLYFGGIEHFEGMDAATIEALDIEGFIDMDGRQNSSPKAQVFYEFIKAHPEFTVSGYAVHERRPDYRVSIDAIVGETQDTATQDEFRRVFCDADELTTAGGKCLAWFD